MKTLIAITLMAAGSALAGDYDLDRHESFNDFFEREFEEGKQKMKELEQESRINELERRQREADRRIQHLNSFGH